MLQSRLAAERVDAIIKSSHYTWMLYAYDAFWRYGIGVCDIVTCPSVGCRHDESAVLLSQV
jgi:hypothetical protein